MEEMLLLLNEFSNLTSFEKKYSNLNIYKTDTHHMIEILCPGIEKDELNVDIQNNILKVSTTPKKLNEKYYISGFKINPFTVSVNLANVGDTNNVSADLKNGILYVKVGLKAPNKINVTVR